jgi:hypothetical protein
LPRGPLFSAAVVAAATSLGYQVVYSELEESTRVKASSSNSVQLQVDQSEIVTNQLGRSQRITVAREGVSVTFSRDARAKPLCASLVRRETTKCCVRYGEELSKSVVQHYVYQRLVDENASKGFVVVEEERDEDRAIRLKVRHWEN